MGKTVNYHFRKKGVWNTKGAKGHERRERGRAAVFFGWFVWFVVSKGVLRKEAHHPTPEINIRATACLAG